MHVNINETIATMQTSDLYTRYTLGLCIIIWDSFDSVGMALCFIVKVKLFIFVNPYFYYKVHIQSSIKMSAMKISMIVLYF